MFKPHASTSMIFLRVDLSESISIVDNSLPNHSPVKVDVSILLLLTNRYNKGILLHFCQQNGKKIAKLKILTKPSGNGLKNILGQKKFLVPRPK